MQPYQTKNYLSTKNSILIKLSSNHLLITFCSSNTTFLYLFVDYSYCRLQQVFKNATLAMRLRCGAVNLQDISDIYIF